MFSSGFVGLEKKMLVKLVMNDTYQDGGQESKCGCPDARIHRKHHKAL